MDSKDWSTILKAAMLVVTIVVFAWRMRKKYTVHAGAVLLDKANKLMGKGDFNKAVSLYRQAVEHPTPEISRAMICLTASAHLQDAEHNLEARNLPSRPAGWSRKTRWFIAIWESSIPIWAICKTAWPPISVLWS